jgi:TrpR family trp operon transcriptional repressor
MDNLKEISKILARLNSARMIEEFIRSILTDNEAKNLSSRWEIIKRIDQGISQRKIANDLRLSLCKITRGSRELKKSNSVLKRILTKHRSVIKGK